MTVGDCELQRIADASSTTSVRRLSRFARAIKSRF
jgi:hypothetical protein